MKTSKRLLSVAMSAVLLFGSAFSALADDAVTTVQYISGTVTASNVSANAGDTEVTVPVEIKFEGQQVSPHGMFDITADGATLKSATLTDFDNANYVDDPDITEDDVDKSVYVDADDVNTANGRIVVESATDESKQPATTYVKLDVVLGFATELTAGQEIEVVISNIQATNLSEYGWDGMSAVNGKITVEADEPECEHVNVTLEYSTIENGDTYTCITKEVCNDCNEYENIIAELDSMKYNHTLTLQSDLTIKFLHAESTGWTNYSDCYMSFVKEVYDASGAIIDYRNDTISDYIVNGGYMTVDYKGVSAKEMGDIIHAKTFGKDAEGRVILLAAEEYSIKEYTDNQFPKTTTAIVKLKPLLVNLLNYGAAAQVNFEYNSANLVNADLTDELKALAVSERTYVSVKDFDNAFYPENDIFSRSLVLKNAVEVNLILKKSELKKIITDEDYSDLNIVVEYETTSGSKSYANYSIADETIQPNGTSYYVASFRDITAANMSTAFVASVYDGETYLGNTTYSIESYTASYYNSADENLANLVKALTAYGDAAAAYLKS